MKNAPTLADACVASMLDKRICFGARGVYLRPFFAGVAPARKFVLDRQMSCYLAELSIIFWRGGERKRRVLIDNVRRQARIPHASTWIELSWGDYLRRAQEHGICMVDFDGKKIAIDDPNYVTSRLGYLLRQHADNPAAVLATEFFTSTVFTDRAGVKPLSVVWTTDDSPSPYPRFTDLGDREAELITRATGYASQHTHFVANFGEPYMSHMIASAQDFVNASNSIPLRDLWSLLATINDLPTMIEHVIPTKGYVSRGRYQKFLTHSVIHLTVPETRWRALVLKTAARVRRRAHQVRGHWRKDYHNPLNPTCAHEFDGNMVCGKCHGRQLWIAEHQRGDVLLGFVTHDYEVHRAEAKPTSEVPA